MDRNEALAEQEAENVPSLVKISVYVTPAMVARLEDICEGFMKQDRPTSVSNVVREALAHGIPEIEKKQESLKGVPANAY